MNTDWSRTEGSWERLAWAREHAGYPTVRAASESLGIRENTYAAFERPPESSRPRKLDHQSAIQFGKKFKVSWIWLLLGEGTPFDKNLSEAQQRAVQAMEGASDDDQARVAEMIELFLRKTG